MRAFVSSVSPKGQISLPAEVRKRLGIKPKDKVTIDIEDDAVRVRPAGDDSFLASYQSVPALSRRLSDDEVTQIAAEEHAQQAAKDGL